MSDPVDESSPPFERLPLESPPVEQPKVEQLPSTRPRPRLNTLAVAALVLAIMLSPLAALFGHIAASQISRSQGAERGVVIAWVAVGLGYVWLVGAIVVGVVIWRVLNG